MSGGLTDELLSNLLFLYFFQKPVRASAEKKNTFNSNLWLVWMAAVIYVVFLFQTAAITCCQMGKYVYWKI